MSQFWLKLQNYLKYNFEGIHRRKIDDKERKLFFLVVNMCIKFTLRKG